jgi:hypothetical protein
MPLIHILMPIAHYKKHEKESLLTRCRKGTLFLCLSYWIFTKIGIMNEKTERWDSAVFGI